MKAAMPLMAAVALGAAGIARADLKVESPAPPIKVVKWLKGAPVPELKRGNIYVVEFWATWCGPCRVSIPHLTEMAKKYAGKITFIGVDSFEHPKNAKDTSYYTKVADFVKEMGPKMDYHVCMDGPEQTMGKTWMDAAHQNGIPCAFVVGREGKILWMGHPMAMDGVLQQVSTGTFNPKAAEAAREKANARRTEMMQAMQPISQAVNRRDFKGAVAATDAAMAKYPEMAPQLAMTKYGLLMRYDEKGMAAYGRHLADTTFKSNAQALNEIAWMMVDDKTPLKTRDYDSALYVAERSAKLTSYNDPMILDTLATAYYKKGDKPKAIQLETKAVSLLDKGNIPAQEKQQIRDTLAKFKRGG